MMQSFEQLLTQIRACTLCAPHLPLGPRPVVQIHPQSRILIIAQAPGRKVHETGIPFNDASGNRLRDWLGVTREQFYDAEQIAILPMGFCYPGAGKSGDLPPRQECAPTWHSRVLEQLNRIELTLLIGKYAQDYYLSQGPATLTERVKSWQSHWPGMMPLPHPSPRNNIWLRRNPWFGEELLPALRERVAGILN